MPNITTLGSQELAILLRGFEHLDQAAIITSLDRHILGMNLKACELFGYHKQELAEQSTRLLYASTEEYQRLGKARYDELNQATNNEINVHYKTKGNSAFIGRTHGGLVYDDNQRPCCIVTLISDVTTKVATEEALNQLHVITSSRQLTFEQRIQSILDLGTELFGLPIGIFSKIRNSEYIIQQAVHPDDALEQGMTFDLAGTYCSQVYQANDAQGFNHVSQSELAHHPCFKNFGLEAYLGAPIVVDGDRYGTLNFSSPNPCRPFIKQDIELVKLFSGWMGHEIGRHHDLQALENAHAKMELIANTDELTGLANRRQIELTLQALIQESGDRKQPLSIAIIDLDRFKHVNDTYGHSMGDQTLKAHSELMRKNCRITDLYGRWGGEEFIAILPNTTLHNAVTSVERYRVKAQSHIIDARIPELVVTASIGVTQLRPDDTLDSLVNRADGLLYRAKQNGRNHIQYEH